MGYILGAVVAAIIVRLAAVAAVVIVAVYAYQWVVS